MKKIITALVLGLVASLAPAVAADAKAPMQCIDRPRVVGKHDFGTSTVAVTIWHQYCWPTNNPNPKAGVVRVTRAMAIVDRDGSRASCNHKVDPWRGVEFRIYLYHPYTGMNWNSALIQLPCSTDTTTGKIIDISSAPDFPYKGAGTKGVRPQWRFSINEKWDWAIPDNHAQISGSFPHP